MRPGRALAKADDLKDVVFELGVTPNRPDVLSHHGVAREIAAAFHLVLPKHSVRVRESGGDAKARASARIEDPDRCGKYSGRVITGVQVGPSPAWVRRRLKAVGIRSISNVVDATNLALLELGQPLHAFDLQKVHEGALTVRTAHDRERLELLDGTTRTLSSDDLVIADGTGAVALAGVMGGASSEVGPSTSEVLLESAYFDPRSVRRTSKRHGLHTEASHRFERGVDFMMVDVALDRCAQLIVDLAGGQILRGRVGEEKKVPAERVVPIRPERATRLIGRPVDKKEVRSTLTALGLRPVRKPAAPAKKGNRRAPAKGADAVYFRIPSWRVDLSLEEDLIEEVARLAGYDEVPAVMPPTAPSVLTEAPPDDPERRIKELLAAEGCLECISLAFDAGGDVTALGLSLERFRGAGEPSRRRVAALAPIDARRPAAGGPHESRPAPEHR